MVPEFVANYNAAYSSVIDNTPYTLETSRVYPHHTDSHVEAVLDEALGCTEPTVSLTQMPLLRDEQAAVAVEKARASQKLSADRYRINPPMIKIGREVLYTPIAPPGAQIRQGLAGTRYSAGACGTLLNKEYRMHLKNIMACIPPIGRKDRRPMGTIAATPFGQWFCYSSQFADEDDDHTRSVVKAFRTSVPAQRYFGACNGAFRHWNVVLNATGRSRGDDFTLDDETHFLFHAPNIPIPIPNAKTGLTDLKKAYLFANNRAERGSQLAK
ncbi:hypothetical protein SARC_04321 [Sphaeroforma arctica JP610]|uniref:Uncharacterized protein n=1 Tax=Sphaeroforma arctica JP610 TaxID=667725 RepID=A0A0L0G3I9_9EUKA|nr:hypothetical protein SARC_04321 [Sphaeroforma arctica JP610]KNC83434.1 hypothetical protein SARC_04321 [Sphaeroforma arctica JP610]|eukprot:XP_014157336.1 hypothetical protein SARC_04321 [Sphaeroforma arctica JP610]